VQESTGQASPTAYDLNVEVKILASVQTFGCFLFAVLCKLSVAVLPF
jgi:hypothetical protein